MSDSIIGRIDEMGSRIDDLEKSIGDLIQQAGLEEVDICWNRVCICCKRFWTKSVKSAVLFGSWLFDSIPTPSRACFACLSSSLPLRVWPRDREGVGMESN